MLHLLLLIVLILGGVYYGESHGLIHPGGIIPDLRGLHLPDVNIPLGNGHPDYWKRG